MEVGLTHGAEENIGSSEASFEQTTETQTDTQTTTEGQTTEVVAGEAEAEAVDTLTIPEVTDEEDAKTTPDEAEETKEVVTEDFDTTEVETEFFANKGELSQETLESLYKQFPKNLVDKYMSNAKAAYDASISSVRTEVFGVVGGEAQYAELIKWASSNLAQDEIGAFNNVMAGTDTAAMKLAVKGIYAQANSGKLSEPKLITSGKATVSLDGQVFESQAQYVAAISDPRYEKDAAYRSEVRSKLALTKKAGGYKK